MAEKSVSGGPIPIKEGVAPMGLGIPNKNPAGSVNSLLARVLARQHISVVYQPIVELQNRQTIGYEALARPSNMGDSTEVGGFFALAEQAGVIRDLDWLCRRAAVAGIPTLPGKTFLSINVSTELLMDNPALDAAVIMELIGGTDLPPGRVVLEVTPPENGAMDKFLGACQEYRKLKLLVAVSGVDPQHAGSIRPGAFDVMKLSREVALQLEDPVFADFVRKAVEFGKANRVNVIAQGIEIEEMVPAFMALGIAFGQGFHLGRPEPIETYIPPENEDES
jgi:EAL domain-containing protein (putative c-di-GMP-specific phosphodiesterase class I)